MSPVYIFPGLGTDKRVFKYMNFSGLDMHYINWVSPAGNEPISHYARRITSQIKADYPILIGVSFGGIMAVEVAKLIPYTQLILIASAKTKHEIPFYYRLNAFLHLHKIIPARLLKQQTAVTNWFFGVNENREKLLLREILQDTDAVFLKWAIDKIVNWQNTYLPENCVHIHGTADRILPVKFVNANVIIKDGGHFMTVNKAGELTQIIKHLLPVE